MLSVAIALGLGLSWPVSRLAVASLTAQRDFREAGPVLPLIWFALLLALLLLALEGVASVAEVRDVLWNAFPVAHSFH